MFKTTAFDVWRGEQQMRKLITLCSELDNQLGGGISRKKITEFSGGPGTGKTQMCLQLCLTVQFPADCGGLSGKSIFFDTNQDFSSQRLNELAEHISKRFQRLFQNKPSNATYNVENLLRNISYLYCSNYQQLWANIILLPNLLKNDSMIKLIVVDSFSFLIRNIDDGVTERTRILFEILTKLHKIAYEFNIAIIITNELTTRFTGNSWIIRPTLGNIHLGKVNNRIVLSQSDNFRYAFIAKSFTSPNIDIPIQIKANGIRSLQT